MTRRLALLNCFVVLGLLIMVLFLDGLSVVEGGSLSSGGLTLLGAPLVLIFSVLAYLIVVRRPENVLGTGFSHLALIFTLAALTEAYLHYGMDVSNRSLPAIESVGDQKHFRTASHNWAYAFEAGGRWHAADFQVEGEPGRFFTLAESLLACNARREAEASAGHLKDILAARVPNAIK